MKATTRQAVREVLGEAPACITALPGATSSDLYRLDLAERTLVLRIFRPERWPSDPALLSNRELAILSTLSDTGLPGPLPVATLPGNGCIMTFLEGECALPEAPDRQWISSLAQHLVRIHESKISVPYVYESWRGDVAPTPPDWWNEASAWHAARDLSARPPSAEPVFLHRDYHPLNVLWREGRVSGIVDWINACMGPRAVDVAHCRCNLALIYDQARADAFLQVYQDFKPGFRYDPFWDIDEAMGWLPEALPYPPWREFGLTGITAELVRERLEVFVSAALAARPSR